MSEMFGITVQNVKSVNGQIQHNFNSFALYIKISGIETWPVNLEFRLPFYSCSPPPPPASASEC